MFQLANPSLQHPYIYIYIYISTCFPASFLDIPTFEDGTSMLSQSVGTKYPITHDIITEKRIPQPQTEKT